MRTIQRVVEALNDEEGVRRLGQALWMMVGKPVDRRACSGQGHSWAVTGTDYRGRRSSNAEPFPRLIRISSRRRPPICFARFGERDGRNQIRAG